MTDPSISLPPVAPTEPKTPAAGWAYAGFSVRATAFSIDQLLLMLITILLSLPFAVLLVIGHMIAWPFAVFIIMPTLSGLYTGIAWLYFALQESSFRQATWGKRICGLRVTDMDGRRISFARATVRFFGKYISAAVMLLGFVMAAFTERHQALHDIIAETLVVKKTG